MGIYSVQAHLQRKIVRNFSKSPYAILLDICRPERYEYDDYAVAQFCPGRNFHQRWASPNSGRKTRLPVLYACTCIRNCRRCHGNAAIIIITVRSSSSSSLAVAAIWPRDWWFARQTSPPSATINYVSSMTVTSSEEGAPGCASFWLLGRWDELLIWRQRQRINYHRNSAFVDLHLDTAL